MAEQRTAPKARKHFGGQGETIACQFLEARGMEIADRNWRAGHFELDLVARKGCRAHVVEVKSRKDTGTVAIEELLKPRQGLRLLAAADVYAKKHTWVEEIQIDLMVILFSKGSYRIEYLPDAVLPGF